MFGAGPGIKLGRILGVEVLVDWLFILVLGVLWFNLNTSLRNRGYAREAAVLAAIAAAGFFLSVLIHELSHSLMAKARHLPVTRIRLHLFGGASELGSDTASAGDEFIVTAVGPGSSFALAGLLHLMARSSSGGIASIFGLLAFLNLSLGIFNVIPAFPLDGGRILRAVVWGATHNRTTGTTVAARSGQVLGVLMIVGGAISAVTRDPFDLWFCLIGWTIVTTATGTLKGLVAHRALDDTVAADLMWDRPLAVHPEESLARLAPTLEDAPYPAFPVVDDLGRVVGMLDLEHLDLSGTQIVAAVMGPPGPMVQPLTPGPEVLEALRAGGGAHIAVVDPAGRLVGLVTAGTLTHALQQREH